MANNRQKIKVRIIGNDEISKEEEAVIWDKFFNIGRIKEIKGNSSENHKNDSVVSGDKLLNNQSKQI